MMILMLMASGGVRARCNIYLTSAQHTAMLRQATLPLPAVGLKPDHRPSKRRFAVARPPPQPQCTWTACPCSCMWCMAKWGFLMLRLATVPGCRVLT